MDSTKYWNKVREYQNSLPGAASDPMGQDVFHVTSIEDDTVYRKGGVTVMVPRHMVGKLVVGGSHKLATDAEKEAFKKAQEEHLESERMKRLTTDQPRAIDVLEALRMSRLPETETAAAKIKKPVTAQ